MLSVVGGTGDGEKERTAASTLTDGNDTYFLQYNGGWTGENSNT